MGKGKGGNMEKILAHKKAIAIVIVSILVLVAAIVIILDILKNARVNILVTPIDASVTINGKKYSPGSHRLFPGEAEVVISHEGFDSKTIKVNLQANHTETIYIALNNTALGMKYYESDRNSYEVLKMISDSSPEIKEFVNQTEEKIAIRDILPIRSSSDEDSYDENDFRGTETVIGDATDRKECDQVVCLYLLTNSKGDKSARELMHKYGYEYDDYKFFKDSY